MYNWVYKQCIYNGQDMQYCTGKQYNSSRQAVQLSQTYCICTIVGG